MNADGSEVKKLTNSEFNEWGAVWIDSKSICYLRQTDSGIERIKLDLITMEETALPHPAQCILDDKNMIYIDENTSFYLCKTDI